MNVISNVASVCMSFGLAVLAGSFIFGGGALGITGWLISLPLFIGSCGVFAVSAYNLIPERKRIEAATDVEMQGRKPANA